MSRPQVDDKPRKVGDSVPRICPMCGGTNLRVHFIYDRQPPGEFTFEAIQNKPYRRELHRCEQCSHLLEWINADLTLLYQGDYVSKVWGDRAGIKRAFDKVIALPPEKSDNMGRVGYICAFIDRIRPDLRLTRKPRVLDVGTGLGVFPYRMQQAGWECVGIDLDETLIAHVRAATGIRAEVADVTTLEGFGPFDLVTFNKVLEHVADPVAILASVPRLLAPGGAVYVELPDGEAAELEGQDREEYLLGHIHVFSAASYAHLIERAGLELLTFERLREPSTKFTLRGFATPSNVPNRRPRGAG